ncbi:MAG: LD-carboxypeptidase, partial [Comamonas sp.]
MATTRKSPSTKKAPAAPAYTAVQTPASRLEHQCGADCAHDHGQDAGHAHHDHSHADHVHAADGSCCGHDHSDGPKHI